MKSSRKGITWFLLSLLLLPQILLPSVSLAATGSDNISESKLLDTNGGTVYSYSKTTNKITARYALGGGSSDTLDFSSIGIIAVNNHQAACENENTCFTAPSYQDNGTLNKDRIIVIQFDNSSGATSIQAYAYSEGVLQIDSNWLDITVAHAVDIKAYLAAHPQGIISSLPGSFSIQGTISFPADIRDNKAALLDKDRVKIDLIGPGFSLPGGLQEQSPPDTQKVNFTVDTKGTKFQVNTDYRILLSTPKALKVSCLSASPSTSDGALDVAGNVANAISDQCALSYSASLTFQIASDGRIKSVIESDSTSQSNLTDGAGAKGRLISTPTGTDWLQLSGTETFDSPLDQVISNSIKLIAGGVNSCMSFVMTQIDNLLGGTENFVLGKVGEKPALNAPWVVIKNLALSLLVMALIIIAFANVVQVDIEQYGLNRMIPKIIISIVMAMSSWLIVTFFFDMSAAIQAQAKGLAQSVDIIAGLKSLQITTPSGGAIMANIGILVMIIVVLVGVLLCAIVLMFLLLIRSVFLAFLLVVAPLAFIFNILPFTQGLTKQWWTEFFKWMFMGPIAMAIIAIGELIAASASMVGGNATITSGAVSLGTDTASRDAVLFGLVVFAAALYMAATLPLQWGGKIMSSWAGIGKGILGSGKKATNFAAGAVGITGAKDMVKGRVGDWFAEGKTKREHGLARTLTGGRVGMSKEGVNQMILQNRIKKRADEMQLSSLKPDAVQGELLKAERMGDEASKQAIYQHLASSNDLEQGFAEDKRLVQDGAWLSGSEYLQQFKEDAAQRGITTKKQADDYLNQQQARARTLAGLHVLGSNHRDAVLENMVKTGQGEVISGAYNALFHLYNDESPEEAERLTGFTREQMTTQKDKMERDGTDIAATTRATSGLYKGMMSGYKGKQPRAIRPGVIEATHSGDLGQIVDAKKLVDILGTATGLVTPKLTAKTTSAVERVAKFNPDALKGLSPDQQRTLAGLGIPFPVDNQE